VPGISLLEGGSGTLFLLAGSDRRDISVRPCCDYYGVRGKGKKKGHDKMPPAKIDGQLAKSCRRSSSVPVRQSIQDGFGEKRKVKEVSQPSAFGVANRGK